MAISDLARRVDDSRPWRTCYVCAALSELPPSEADALRALLANPRIRYTELSEALAADPDHPLSLGVDTLSRHARGRCEAREKLRAA